MEVTGYKCPCCGAPVVFSSESQQMKCENCGNEFKVEDVKNFNEASKQSEEESRFDWEEYEGETVEGTVTYTCPNCGGEIIGDSNTAATRCPYCDNVAIMEGRVSGMLKPDLVIPFKTTKDDATAALKNFYKNKKLLPDSFKNANRIKEIKGIYVPFWLFDCDADANLTFDATRVTSWRSGDYQYTKTSHFAAIRDGEMGFDGIPADASKKMDDAFMDSLEPFDYNDGVSFETAYLSGFFADKYDVSSAESSERANRRVKHSIETAMMQTVIGYNSVLLRNSSVRTKNNSVRYALLPVWILNTKYEGKMYTFAMNGQTGKIVGSLPVDKRKFWCRFFAFFGITAVILAAIMLIGGMLL